MQDPIPIPARLAERNVTMRFLKTRFGGIPVPLMKGDYVVSLEIIRHELSRRVWSWSWYQPVPRQYEDDLHTFAKQLSEMALKRNGEAAVSVLEHD